jgi:type IV secretory pathway VirD2 relaxase
MSRRVVVQTRFVQGGLAAKAALHLPYVEREGIEWDGSQGLLYGGASREAELARPLVQDELRAPLDGEKHQFRMIIATEDGDQLKPYIQQWMARVEKDLGQRRICGAVNHYDADNPHAHVIVRGMDGEGAQVRFERAYISRALRHRAQELAIGEARATHCAGSSTSAHARDRAKPIHVARSADRETS